jgi:GR25 family glycosyltransferase involved in LPS biosynthesis
LLAYYINLDRRADRRAFMEAQFSTLGMTVERLEATTPDTIADKDIAPLSMKQAGASLSPVEVAVSVSHFQAWKRLLAGGQQRVLVLEDDVRLSEMLPSFLAEFESQGFDTDLLRLETRLSQLLLHRRAEPGPSGFSLHMPLSYEAGSAAYIISAGHAARILASPQRFAMPIDDILFSLKSPFRQATRLRVAVPALALFQFETSPEYDVPDSIPTSDAQAGRDVRNLDQARRPKLRGLPRLRREILRLRSQIGGLPELLWLRRQAVSTNIPLAAGAVTEQPSAVRPRG